MIEKSLRVETAQSNGTDDARLGGDPRSAAGSAPRRGGGLVRVDFLRLLPRQLCMQHRDRFADRRPQHRPVFRRVIELRTEYFLQYRFVMHAALAGLGGYRWAAFEHNRTEKRKRLNPEHLAYFQFSQIVSSSAVARLIESCRLF